MIRRLQSLLIPLLLSLTVCLPVFAAESSEKATLEFKARQLWQSFQDDQAKAEQELIGKTIQITGIVVETGMSIYLTPNVRLSNAADGTIYVSCVLPRADTGLLSSFNKGDHVTMSGRVHRLSPRTDAVVIKESKRVP